VVNLTKFYFSKTPEASTTF